MKPLVHFKLLPALILAAQFLIWKADLSYAANADDKTFLHDVAILVEQVELSLDNGEPVKSREARGKLESMDRKKLIEALGIIYKDPKSSGVEHDVIFQSAFRSSCLALMQKMKMPMPQILSLVRERYNEMAAQLLTEDDVTLVAPYEQNQNTRFLTYNGDNRDEQTVEHLALALEKRGKPYNKLVAQDLKITLQQMRSTKRGDWSAQNDASGKVRNDSLAAYPKKIITSIGDGLRDTAEDHGWIVWLLVMVMTSLGVFWWLKRKSSK